MDKNILFITTNFIPSDYIADVRTRNLVKILHYCGYKISVISLEEKYYERRVPEQIYNEYIKEYQVRRIGTKILLPSLLGLKSYSLVERSLFFKAIINKFWRAFGFNPDMGWKCYLKAAIRKELSNSTKDFILVSGGPFSAFGIVMRESKKYTIPYYLDYRDAWHFEPHSTNKLLSKLYIKDEIKILDHAKGVFMVSDGLRQGYINKLPALANKVITLRNAIDEEYIRLGNVQRKALFTITYAGSFYLPFRIIDSFFKVLRILKNENFIFEFLYIGSNTQYIIEKGIEYNIKESIRITGDLSKNDTLNLQASAHLNLVIIGEKDECDNNWERGVITGKIYECLGINTPVLIIGPRDSEVNDIIKKSSRAKRYCASDTEGIKQYIKATSSCPSNESEVIIDKDLLWSSHKDLLCNFLR